MLLNILPNDIHYIILGYLCSFENTQALCVVSTKYKTWKEWVTSLQITTQGPSSFVTHVHGKIHCCDGPAIVWDNGNKNWYFNDKLHRDNGPALEHTASGGGNEWYNNGKLHRHDGPAIDHPIDGKYWYTNGKLHRTNGPAIERTTGIDTGFQIKEWYLDGLRHRDANSGPASEHFHGKHWYKHGKLHNDNAPAVILAQGDKYWYKEGKLHNTKGPAILFSDGYKLWYNEGVCNQSEHNGLTIKFEPAQILN